MPSMLCSARMSHIRGWNHAWMNTWAPRRKYHTSRLQKSRRRAPSTSSNIPLEQISDKVLVTRNKTDICYDIICYNWFLNSCICTSLQQNPLYKRSLCFTNSWPHSIFNQTLLWPHQCQSRWVEKQEISAFSLVGITLKLKTQMQHNHPIQPWEDQEATKKPLLHSNERGSTCCDSQIC